ncbi:MAG: sigma-70 family RNA polymerase sigma factor [Oscillospiraceae bacterium]|jgi:RNA polymerase sigma-70 factor (ECF subfamily)|nr:sigma-70 family RNA polymerase sigma factor [Oscillospiraceae bacterium]
MDFADFSLLVEQHGAALYRFCVRLSAGDADDLYQETFLRLWERRRRVDAGGNIRSYLFTTCINLFRSARRRPTPLPLDELPDRVSTLPLPDVQLERDDEIALLQRCIAALPEKMRVVLVLHYTNDCKVGQIARILKIPPGTVKSRLHKARALLKQQLEASGYDTTTL